MIMRHISHQLWIKNIGLRVEWGAGESWVCCADLLYSITRRQIAAHRSAAADFYFY